MSLEAALRRIQEVTDTKDTILDLTGCDIEELPREIAQLTWLEELRADGDENWEKYEFAVARGRITEIPTWIR